MLSLFFGVIISFSIHAKEVALTFDDAPMGDMSVYSGDERTRVLIEVLERHKIKTVFFSISSNLKKSNGLERMNKYQAAGHLIANHTNTHPNFDETSIEKYIADFNTADEILRQFKNFRPWFRFPMLRHGNTPMKRDLMRKHLDKKGYQNGYVTLDIQDWFMASLVNDGVKAGRKLNKQKLCLAYSEMIWDTMVFYDTKAIELLKRSPKHMLLLHENDQAAMCVDTLIAKIKLNGWKIVSPEVAMEDEIYKRTPNTLFNNNGQIAALYFETTGIKLNDPWSHPWEDGKVIREEFERRDVFEK